MTVLSLPRESVRHILVCHVARIGDTVLTSPSIRLLSEHFPYAQIDFLGHPKRYQVLMHLPYLRRVGAISKRSAPFKGWWSWLAAQFGKAKPYDLAVVWGHDESIVTFILRISQFVVSQKTKKSLPPLKNQCIIDIGKPPNSVDNPDESLMSWREKLLLLSFGISNSSETKEEYVVSESENQWATTWIRQALKNHENYFLVGLVINTFPVGTIEKFPEREWPVDCYIQLCKKIIEKKQNVHFILIGINDQSIQARKFIESLKDKVVIAKNLSIRQSASIINNINLYIGGDTGPTHIAAALGIKSVGIFHCYLRGRQVVLPKNRNNFIIIDHPEKNPNTIFKAKMIDIKVELILNKIDCLL